MKRMIAVTALALALLAACGGDADTATEGEDTVSPPAPTSTPAPEADPTPPAEPTAASAPEEPASGSVLGAFEPFGDGTYTINELGVPVTFTVSGQWSTQPVGPGFFVITTPGSRGPGDHDIVAIAPTNLFDATSREPSLAGDDLAGWLDSVPDTATVSESTTSEIGGFAATVFTIDVGDTPCADNQFACVDFALVGSEFGKSFDRGFVYEVQWVEHPEGPFAFVIGTPADDVAWLDTARAVTATVTFG